MAIHEGAPEAGGGAADLPLLALDGIGKRFPGVNALTGVDLALRSGRAHALVGENGAGKSTLVKIIAGMLQPNEGRIHLDGQQVHFRSPIDARHQGISLVPQELSLVSTRSVAENIYMGHLPRRGPLVNTGELNAATRRVLEPLGLDIDPSSRMGRHAPAVQQLVMVARGIALHGRLFILDEPTAALTDPEIVRLLAVLDELKTAGAALVYVTHRLGELREIADDITVLRDGRVVDRLLAKQTNEDQLVQSMIGRPVERFFPTRSADNIRMPVMLSVEGLTRPGALDDVSFSVRSGEIVGLAGLMGAGRTEVARALFGLDRFERGTIRVDGHQVRINSPKDAIAAGLALVPEERKAQALVLDMSVSDNIVLPHLRTLATGVVLFEGRLRSYSRKIVTRAGIRVSSVTTRVRNLSGGNQQKVVLGRWLTGDRKVYILDEPTRGIDVQAKTEIYREIERLKHEGAAVLVISSELPELLGICDRILVMRFGRIVGEVEGAAATEASLLALAMVDEFLQVPKEAVQFAPVPGPVVTGPVSGREFSLPFSASLPLEDGPIGDSQRTYTFCFSQSLIQSSWADAQRESAMLEAARHPNLRLRFFNTDDDAAKQVEDLDACTADHPDAILVWPHSVARLTFAVEHAKKAGLIVVGMERAVATRNYDSWIWLDYPQETSDLAEAVAAQVGVKGVVGEVPGTMGTSPQILRHDGFMKAIARYPGIKVVTTRPTNYTTVEGYRVALDFLKAGTHIDAWYVHYSAIARGVWQAMQELGRTDIPIFTHVDGKEAVQDVFDGAFRAVAPHTPLHGDLAVRAAAYLVMGKEVPKDILLSSSPLITKENADEWLHRSWASW